MAREYAMTWVKDRLRWMKKHKGKMYAVSCKSLGVAESKEASWKAANDWWEAKLKEIEKASPSEGERLTRAMTIRTTLQEFPQLSDTERERLLDSLLGEGEYEKLKSQAAAKEDSLSKPVSTDRTINSQIEKWKETLRSRVAIKKMSEGRYDGYSRNIKRFEEWIGKDASINDIDEDRLEGYFIHLSAQVGSGDYSATYANTLFMTARQFITRLTEKRLIPTLANIGSRSFRFGQSAATKVETFTVAEIRAMLERCRTDRTRLYLLLALNCGMYQNDMAEMRKDEIDWKAGTIKRARSKTKDRNGPVVTYRLWPETLAILKRERAGEGDLVLTTATGKPLVAFWIEDGKMKRYDGIRAAWEKLDARLPLKHLRKTSATLLAENPTYKYYVGHFLADSPKGMDQKHYVKPSEDEFAQALEWLRAKLLIESVKQSADPKVPTPAKAKRGVKVPRR